MMDGHEKRIEAAYLVGCAPQRAYDWLREHARKDDEAPSILDDEIPAVLEYLLARRNHPLIDLGIARFQGTIREYVWTSVLTSRPSRITLSDFYRI